MQTSVVMSGKKLALMRDRSDIAIPGLAVPMGITERFVERKVQSMPQKQKVKKSGPAKGGHWNVIE